MSCAAVPNNQSPKASSWTVPAVTNTASSSHVTVCVKRLHPTARPMDFEMENESSISALKQKIQKVYGLAPSAQLVIHQGKALMADSLLADLPREADSNATVVYLVCSPVKGKQCVTIKVKDLTAGGEIYTVSIDGAASLADLKALLYSKKLTSIPPKQQNLSFKGSQTSNMYILQEYVSGQKAVPFVLSRKHCQESATIRVSIRFPNSERLHEVTCETSYTVCSLRKVLTKMYALPPTVYQLVYKGKLLQDSKTLKFYGIRDASEIEIVPNNRIRVHKSGSACYLSDRPVKKTKPSTKPSISRSRKVSSRKFKTGKKSAQTKQKKKKKGMFAGFRRGFFLKSRPSATKAGPLAPHRSAKLTKKESTPAPPSSATNATSKLRACKPVKPSRSRCCVCRKKLSMAMRITGKCKCSQLFCTKHKENHKCNYDYASEHKKHLQKSNPLCNFEKMNRL